MSIAVKIVDHAVCEIEYLKKGETRIADMMLRERVEATDRLWAIECLRDYPEISSYIYEQLKELTTKMIT